MNHLNNIKDTTTLKMKTLSAYNTLNSFYLRKHWPLLLEQELFWKTCLQQLGVMLTATLIIFTFLGACLAFGAWVSYLIFFKL